jgi:hypothetical protein
MRINEVELLKELRKNTDKSKRVNSYKVKYLKFSGEYEELIFNQGYDAGTDCYNPFFVRVYSSDKNYLISGSADSIENSYNSLITSLIQYKDKAEKERDEANVKLAKILGVFDIDADELDERF